MKAIEKAWSENISLPKDDQWVSKEAIINNLCPYEYNLKSNPYCKQEGEDVEECTKCWNKTLVEDEKQDNNIDNQLAFDKLSDCSVGDISINELNEKEFKELLTNNSSLIYVRSDDSFTYDNLPIISKYLMDVYNYATELKNKVEYVDFNTAKEHMHKGNLARYEEYDYYINNGELLRSDDNKGCTLSLRAIESNQWILL